jgi:hypothetical protein
MDFVTHCAYQIFRGANVVLSFYGNNHHGTKNQGKHRHKLLKHHYEA